jgi:hypothetical protein
MEGCYTSVQKVGMALISLGESKWRMLRRVLGKKRFRYADARNMHRFDRKHFDWLIDKGFLEAIGDGLYRVTDKGKTAADLGLYEV